jgi:AAA15 family ATPase/GTPase
LLTRELIRIVMDPDLNTKNAQIIFATHDPLLLDTALLRRDHIWLTEKTREGDSILYALNEYKNPPSKRESLVRGYLSGRYGGIPYIPESLVTAPEPSATAIHE